MGTTPWSEIKRKKASAPPLAPIKCQREGCTGHMVLEDYTRNGELWDEKTRRMKYVPPQLEYSCSTAPKCKAVLTLREHRRSA